MDLKKGLNWAINRTNNNNKILKFIIILYLLIFICISFVFKLIILFLYSTSSPKIVTSE